MTIDTNATRAHACGGTLRIRSEPGTFRLHGTDVPVTEYFWHCDHCGEQLVSEELARVAEQEAATRYRDGERRLAPDDILQLRERFGFSQDLMERALGLGAKTWVRWESGRVVPSRSMDNLLRLIDRDPDALLFLAEVHGVDVGPWPTYARGGTAASALAVLATLEPLDEDFPVVEDRPPDAVDL